MTNNSLMLVAIAAVAGVAVYYVHSKRKAAEAAAQGAAFQGAAGSMSSGALAGAVGAVPKEPSLADLGMGFAARAVVGLTDGSVGSSDGWW